MTNVDEAERIARFIINKPYDYIKEIDAKCLRWLIAKHLRSYASQQREEALEEAAKIADSHANDYVISFKSVADEIRSLRAKP